MKLQGHGLPVNQRRGRQCGQGREEPGEPHDEEAAGGGARGDRAELVVDAERKRIRRRVEARAAGSMRMSETSAPARCRGGKPTGSGDDALQVRESVEGFQQRMKDEVAEGWQGRGWTEPSGIPSGGGG